MQRLFSHEPLSALAVLQDRRLPSQPQTRRMLTLLSRGDGQQKHPGRLGLHPALAATEQRLREGAAEGGAVGRQREPREVARFGALPQLAR